jgi:hypothetical protein
MRHEYLDQAGTASMDWELTGPRSMFRLRWMWGSKSGSCPRKTRDSAVIEPTGWERSGTLTVPEGCQYSDSSGGELVLVDQSAENVAPTNGPKVGGRHLGLLGACRGLELQSSMGSGPVVVLGVRADHPVQVSSSADERPVQTLRAYGPNPSLREGVGPCDRNGVRTTSRPSVRKTSSNGPEYFASRSRTRTVASSRRPSTARFLACCVTHAESGCSVTAETWIFLERSAMKNST